MTNPVLPHHKLIAYQLALELVRLIAQTRISDATQREHARKSATSAARNIAEAAGRFSRADKSRVFAIARGEVCEACAAVEIAEALGAASRDDLLPVQALAKRLCDVLSRLVS